jgi:hypothetical protein
MTESSAKIVLRTLSHRQKLFSAHSACGNNVGLQISLKIICRELSHRQQFFPVGWAIAKNYFQHVESSAKNASMRTQPVSQQLDSFRNFSRWLSHLARFHPYVFFFLGREGGGEPLLVADALGNKKIWKDDKILAQVGTVSWALHFALVSLLASTYPAPPLNPPCSQYVVKWDSDVDFYVTTYCRCGPDLVFSCSRSENFRLHQLSAQSVFR